MFKNDLLKNKNIIITGGGTGLGKQMAKTFLEHGADVSILSRNAEHLDAAKKEMKDYGYNIKTEICDIYASTIQIIATIAPNNEPAIIGNPAGLNNTNDPIPARPEIKTPIKVIKPVNIVIIEPNFTIKYLTLDIITTTINLY